MIGLCAIILGRRCYDRTSNCIQKYVTHRRVSLRHAAPQITYPNWRRLSRTCMLKLACDTLRGCFSSLSVALGMDLKTVPVLRRMSERFPAVNGNGWGMHHVMRRESHSSWWRDSQLKSNLSSRKILGHGVAHAVYFRPYIDFATAPVFCS